MSPAPLGLGVPTMEDPSILPFKNSSPCSMDGEGQLWPFNLGKPGECPSQILYPRPPTRLCCVHGPDQGLLGGDWDWDVTAQRRGLAPISCQSCRRQASVLLRLAADHALIQQRPRPDHALACGPRPEAWTTRTAPAAQTVSGQTHCKASA